MRVTILISLFLSFSAIAEFKLTVHSKNKPALKVNDEKKTVKPVIKNTDLKKTQAVKNLNPFDGEIHKTPRIQTDHQKNERKVNDHFEKKYKELLANKEKNTKQQELSTKKTSLVSNKAKLLPTLSAKKGETVESVLTKWAKKNQYGIEFNLGEWERALKLPLAANNYYSPKFIDSVKSFLEDLNGLDQFKENNIVLHSCFYTNKFIRIVLNDCGEKS